MIFEIINLISLIVTIILFAYLYTLSIQPMKRVAKVGENGWEDCAKYRRQGIGILSIIHIINYVLWFFYPVEFLKWPISSDFWVSKIIALIIALIFTPIMLIGEKDAGKETLTPSKDTKMYGGIYKYIRHPQTLGEWPLFVSMGFLTNSWFIVLIYSLFILIYTPIMIYYEEIDLEKRFGESYSDYKKNTGALFPKFKNLKKIKQS